MYSPTRNYIDAAKVEICGHPLVFKALHPSLNNRISTSFRSKNDISTCKCPAAILSVNFE